MSRRRKHGESPTLKKTPRKATAAEECGLKVESGKRRLRSAPVHGGAAERPPRPGLQREPPAAASSSTKSHPEGEMSAVWGRGGMAALVLFALSARLLNKFLPQEPHTAPQSLHTCRPEFEHCPGRPAHPLHALLHDLVQLFQTSFW